MLRMLLEPYVIIPVILVLVGITCIKERHMSIYLFALALIIGWMSFHITGLDERYDLYWHFETLDEFRRLGKDYFDVFSKSESLPVFGAYFYLISRLPHNEYLPAITAFLVYGINFFVAYKISKKFELSKRALMLLIIFLLCNLNYAGIISGIRFNLAASIAVLGLYYDFIENKRILPIVLIGISVMLHSSIFIIIVTRLLMIPCRGKWKNLYTVGAVLITTVIISRLDSILSMLPLNSASMSEFARKTDMYMQNIEQGAFWTTSYYAIVIVFFVVILLLFWKNYEGHSEEMQRLMHYQIIMIALIIVFFNNYVVLGRLIIFSNLLMLPYLGILIKSELPNNSFRTLTKIEALVLSESCVRLLYYLWLGGYAVIKLSF